MLKTPNHNRAASVALATAMLLFSNSFCSANEEIYQGLLQSTAWIVARTDSGIQTGSGILVDAQNKLVVTNMHVIENSAETIVFFPVINDDGLVTDRQQYVKNSKTLGIKGKVVSASLERDLAVIELASLPEGIPAVKLAEKAPSPGQTAHSIGSPGATDALWAYTSGTVRAVYKKTFRTKLGKHNFRVVETQAPINSGDSGGPIVNDAGELIGIAQSMSVNARLVSYCVEVSEVRTFLSEPRNAPALALSQQIKAAGFETIRKDGSAIWFRMTGDKTDESQKHSELFALQKLDMVDEVASRRIVCRVSRMTETPSAELMIRLLDQNSRTRTGAWSIEAEKDGGFTVFFSTTVAPNVTTNDLKSVVNYIDRVVRSTRTLFPPEPVTVKNTDSKSEKSEESDKSESDQEKKVEEEAKPAE